jgi:DNA polymerase I
MLGFDINVGQHKLLKEWFKKECSINIASTDEGALRYIEQNFKGTPANVAKTISILRTLEKWYSVYILRFIEKIAGTGRAYSQINANIAVTGRLSGDFQQFPKYAIYDEAGNELFHPRKMIIPTHFGFDTLAFLDYSQIELRVQANYTYEISGGDLNLCRAYIPLKCTHKGKIYDPKLDKDDIFTKNWVIPETKTKWKPLDLHAITTQQAFPNVNVNSAEFEKLRALGKATNFAKNYGASKKALIEQFGFDEETASALDKGYYTAFPKILDYQALVRKIYYQRGYVKNKYGRRYYLHNKRFVYKLYNYIVQGTCADMLKENIIEIDTLLRNYKTRMHMNIHDEIAFEVYKGEEHVLHDIKKIMEGVSNMVIPIIVEVSTTNTNWAEKYTLGGEKV